MLFSREISFLPRKAIKALSCIPLFQLVCVTRLFRDYKGDPICDPRTAHKSID